MGLKDRLKEARKKNTDLGEVVGGYKGDSKDLGKFLKKQIKAGGSREGVIATKTNRQGIEKEIKEPNPGQQKRIDKNQEKWQDMGHKKLNMQSMALRGLGALLGVGGGLMFVVAIVFQFLGQSDLITILIYLIIGIVLGATGSAAFSSGMAIYKFMILNPEKAKKLTDSEIQNIAERFLSGS